VNAAQSIATFLLEMSRNTNPYQFTGNALTRAARVILKISMKYDKMNCRPLTTTGANKTKEAFAVKMMKQAFQK
jgi:hypothetical protein